LEQKWADIVFDYQFVKGITVEIDIILLYFCI
jgi:hypothetical protein